MTLKSGDREVTTKQEPGKRNEGNVTDLSKSLDECKTERGMNRPFGKFSYMQS